MSGGRFSKDGSSGIMDSRDYLAFERNEVLQRRQMINQLYPQEVKPVVRQSVPKQKQTTEHEGLCFGSLDELLKITQKNIAEAPTLFPKILNNKALSDDEKSKSILFHWDDNGTLRSSVPHQIDLPNKCYDELKGNRKRVASTCYIKIIKGCHSCLEN